MFRFVKGGCFPSLRSVCRSLSDLMKSGFPLVELLLTARYAGPKS